MIVSHFMDSRTPIQSPNMPSNIHNKVFAAARSDERHLANVHNNHQLYSFYRWQFYNAPTSLNVILFIEMAKQSEIQQ